MLALKSPLEFKGSKFLQLYFNQLLEVRQAQYFEKRPAGIGMTCVVDEAIRTIRVSVVVIDKNTKMSQIFDQTVKEALLTRVESMGESEIDTIMSLIPEAQFERLAVGTPLQ